MFKYKVTINNKGKANIYKYGNDVYYYFSEHNLKFRRVQLMNLDYFMCPNLGFKGLYLLDRRLYNRIWEYHVSN